MRREMSKEESRTKGMVKGQAPTGEDQHLDSSAASALKSHGITLPPGAQTRTINFLGVQLTAITFPKGTDIDAYMKEQEENRKFNPKILQVLVPHLIRSLMRGMFFSGYNDYHECTYLDTTTCYDHITSWCFTKPDGLRGQTREILMRSPIYQEMAHRWKKYDKFMADCDRRKFSDAFWKAKKHNASLGTIPYGIISEIRRRLPKSTFTKFRELHHPLFQIDNEALWDHHPHGPHGLLHLKHVSRDGFRSNPSRMIDECYYGRHLQQIILDIYKEEMPPGDDDETYVHHYVLPTLTIHTMESIIFEAIREIPNLDDLMSNICLGIEMNHTKPINWKRGGLSKFYHSVMYHRKPNW